MISTLSMSVRFGIRSGELAHRQRALAQHRFDEAREERGELAWSRARLGMALETERGAVHMRDALQRGVEQRAVRGTDIRRQRRLVDGEAVVLAGDEHAPGIELENRMVRAVVAELHLDRLRAAREPEQLLAQADAEHRRARV